MGICAMYQVRARRLYDKEEAQELLDLVIQSLPRGKGYSWAVLGYPFGTGAWLPLNVYCGGETTEQWSLDDQLKDWPQSVGVDNLLGERLLSSFEESKAEALFLVQRSGTKWVRMVDLTN